MFTGHEIHPNPEKQLREFLARHSSLAGAKILSLLINEPNLPHDALELSLRLQFGSPEPSAFLALLSNAWSDVPACDAQALREYRQRLRQLEKLKAQASSENHDCSDLDWETAFLRLEIRRATRPRGGIKNLHPEKKRAYDSLQHALQRLLAKLDDPALARYVRQHLRTGLAFIWIEISSQAPAPGTDLPCLTGETHICSVSGF